jgi:translation initiation factor IF-3
MLRAPVGRYASPGSNKARGGAGFDLVEVAPNANPPVCRIMDYGKFKYQQRKKFQETRKKKVHSTSTVKKLNSVPGRKSTTVF